MESALSAFRLSDGVFRLLTAAAWHLGFYFFSGCLVSKPRVGLNAMFVVDCIAGLEMLIFSAVWDALLRKYGGVAALMECF